MATQPSPPKFVHWLLRASRASQRGFTLIELLVAIIIGSMIMGSLLFLVIELMQANRREEVLTQTQQDMQRAIDYITRDAREAVFVYSTPGAIVEPDGGTDTLLAELGITVNSSGVVTAPTDLAGAIPILAFWRLDPVPTDNGIWTKNCSTAFSGAKINECSTLRLRQSFYTLVVYFQRPNEVGSIWGGPSRIVRYELPKYGSDADIASLIQRKGYSDPTGCTTFETWSAPPGRNPVAPCDSTNSGTTAPNIAVLTDYVNFANLTPDPTCVGQSTPTTASAQGFMACVSGATGTNQTLRIFLQGNATEGRPGIVNTFSEAGRLPTLESEILIRGVLNKQPD
ncbi:MAG: hypothetical protein RLZZ597_3198 [Cyanobacteriota bacterium]|jgi:prepilin-type N-terminal cleavage/methylation domain-containing protein